MSFLQSLFAVVQILSAICLVALVMLQQGKGAEMGAAFGSGSAGGLFGSAGSANFLSRSTAVCATLFFVATLGLAWFAKPGGVNDLGVMGGAANSSTQTVPASQGKETDGAKPTMPAKPTSPSEEIPK